MEPSSLRAAYPVLREIAYLNAGTCGPVAEAAADAARAELHVATDDGRWMPYFERMIDLQARQRAAYAARVGASPDDVALTTSTSEGIVRVLAGLDLGPEDEIITSDEEHPGLMGPLGHLARRLLTHVRIVPFDQLAEAVGPATKLVACSHVSWVNGQVAPAALREVADSGIPVLLDGAQGAGAIPVDVNELGCTFYAAAGQKWLGGPVGTGLLYVDPQWHERLPSIGPTYLNLKDPGAGLDAEQHVDARRHDASALSAEASAFAVAAHEAIDATIGWPAAYERSATLAQRLADELATRGRKVAPRGRTTLVSWVEEDPAAFTQRALAHRVVVRDLPGWPYVRASVGAWNDESDLERLLALIA
ncbi:MAG: putative cysteine desulfurase [Solirubrobacterales bacterium]|jgi:selenocysteine lyase/cysteine desulfurase|nr:putative cysteine desulfurase [Solirubrobacterales bacterium]